MKKIVLLFCFLFSNVYSSDFSHRPWVYFDLGNTLVNTHDFSAIGYFPGAQNYLTELKQLGFNIGMISNVPQKWGQTHTEKLNTLKKFIDDRWVGEHSFDWDVFDYIILPLSDLERKPQPILFLKAMEVSKPCPIIYFSEDEAEIFAAKKLGLAAFRVSSSSNPEYILKDQIVDYIKENYSLEYDQSCFVDIISNN
ncbi:MAG: HAD family hydrolase [Bacteriovoracaceae bacterium]|nr:HAD family hydrolase [Bacteriovoracaceae bacterium]